MKMKKNKNIEGLETRNFNASELRVENQESREVVGYASVFTDADGNPALSENLGGFREIINPNAFDSCLSDENLDCRMLINHDANLILGRTSANTLSLSVDSRGLKYSFTVPETTYGNDLMISLTRGDISQNSFGFIVEDDDWSQSEDGTTIRTINKVSRLLDCSVVTYPAYPDATIGKRNFLNYKTELEKIENEKQQKDLIKRNLQELKIELLKLKNQK
tara:strand:- start:1570 stop:2229 length:660 start_codon:yes stop_codon:yes gene_type:complete